MRPEKIIEAAEELLTQILSTNKPASECVNEYTRARRYIGSKDRRQLTALVWGFLRHKARLEYALPRADLREKIMAVQNETPLDLTSAPDWVKWEVPAWLIPHVPEAEAELPALLETPPVVLRVTGDREAVRQHLVAQGIDVEPTPLSPYGLKMTTRKNVSALAGDFQNQIEVQDEASQATALEVPLQSGDTVLDYCAGAGGKTLILAQMMDNKGQIIAHDVSARSLVELKRRAVRAGVAHMVQTTTDLPAFLADKSIQFHHVVTDVPCSGTGTWRRCPDARWKLTEQQLADLVKTQADIMDTACTHVPVGGTLTYITCSLTWDENEAQINAFILRHGNFELLRARRFSPALTGTDGLFVAVLERRE